MHQRIFFALCMLLFVPNFLSGTTPSHLEDSSQFCKMGFYEMNLGLDAHTANYSNNLSSNNSILNYAGGFSARMQSSFAANFNLHKRFMIADLLSAELATGKINSSFSAVTSALWLSYRFEFGLGMIYKINKKNDAGLNILLLRFAHDNISQNISGSSAMLRYRYSKILIEGGIETRRDRIIGWLSDIQGNKSLQETLTCKYLLNNRKNVGIRCEYFPSNVFIDNENFKNILSVRAFYGIYF